MRRLILAILLLVLAPAALASSEYGDGWKKVCLDTGKCSYQNYHTIQRWDGVYIPYESLNLGTGQWTYSMSENSTHYNLVSLGETLSLPKSFANYDFGLTDISFSFTVTPAQLNSKSTANGSGQWYITIPDKTVKTRFVWDNKKPVVSNNTGDVLDESNYWYSIVNDKRRLNYNQVARNFGIASQTVTFSFDSWTVGSSGSAWDGNSSRDNTTQNQGTTNIELRQQVDDYLSYWRSDGNAKDDNMSGVDGTLTGNAISNSSGKYGTAFKFDGSGDYVELGTNSRYNISGNITITAWINHTAGISDPVFARGSGLKGIVFYDGFNNVRVWFGNVTNTQTVVGSGSITVDTWTFVAVVINGTHVQLYRNANLDANTAQTASLLGAGSINARIGYDSYLLSAYANSSQDDIRIYNRALSFDEINLTRNQSKYTLGNLTTWHDAGTGNETYQLDVNVTTPVNTNYSVTTFNNDTGTELESWNAQTGNTSFTLTTKVQDTKVNVTLYGNTTATPELIAVTFWTQAVSAAGAPNITSYLPLIDSTSTQGTAQSFNITVNQTVNVTWYINGTQKQYNESVTDATYVNNTAGALASYNVTVDVNNSNGATSRMWNWTVTASSKRNPSVDVAVVLGTGTAVAIYVVLRRRRGTGIYLPPIFPF